MAEKRTLYVSRRLLNADAVIAWAKSQGFAKTLAADDMHVTVAYSRNPLDWAAVPADMDTVVVTAAEGRTVEALGKDGEACALRFGSSALASRWQRFCDAGASWDWPDYKPHVTLTYDGADVDLAAVQPFDGPLDFGPEVFAPVDDDWSSKVAEDLALKPDRLAFALDRASVRRVDPVSGHLHVSSTPISISAVNGYLGNEIPGWEDLGLDGSRIYKLYRDPDELAKAADSFNGKPLLIKHKPVHADDHPHDIVVGNVGNVVWRPPYLMAGLDVWTKEAIDGIESNDREQLSCGYGYVPVMKPGRTPSGEDYDGVMTSIHGNHCSLVPEGRAGPTVYVHDAALSRTSLRTLKDLFPMPKTLVPSRTAAMAQGALMLYARPRLAQDAKLDLAPMLKGVTAKNLKAKASDIAKAFDAALRPKLAVDAEMDEAEIQDIVEQVAEVVAERADLIAAEVEGTAAADPEAATDDDDAELKALLIAKGYTEEQADVICAKPDVDGSTATAPTMDAEEKAAEMKTATDAAVKAATKGMVTKEAMDAAITAAVKVASDSALAHQRELRDAEAHVRPAVGALNAQDSAAGVFRTALKVLKVEGIDALPDVALRPVFDAHAAIKAAPTRKAESIAADASLQAQPSFPNANRLRG